jgi:hypothetical protein
MTSPSFPILERRVREFRRYLSPLQFLYRYRRFYSNLWYGRYMYRTGANFITDNQAVYRWNNNKQGIELCHVVALGHKCWGSRTGKFSCKFYIPSIFYLFTFVSHYIILLCTRVCHTLYSVQSIVRATRDGRKYYDNWQSDFAPK